MSLRNVASSATPAVAAPSGNGVLILSVYCPFIVRISIVYLLSDICLSGNGVTTAPGQSPSHGGAGSHHHKGVQRSISASSKQRRGSTGAEANSVIGKFSQIFQCIIQDTQLN